VAAMVKLQQFNVISDPDKVHHRCRAAIQQLTAPLLEGPGAKLKHFFLLNVQRKPQIRLFFLN